MAEWRVALPLYEGRMIGQFDPSAKGWVAARGRSAVWRAIPLDDKAIEPQFLDDPRITFGRTKPKRWAKDRYQGHRIGDKFSDAYCKCYSRDYPTGDSLYTLQC